MGEDSKDDIPEVTLDLFIYMLAFLTLFSLHVKHIFEMPERGTFEFMQTKNWLFIYVEVLILYLAHWRIMLTLITFMYVWMHARLQLNKICTNSIHFHFI